MGDRVLFQVCNADKSEISPVAYCHSSGYDAPRICKAMAKRMADRRDDVAYTFARLMQIAMENDDRNLGFGAWNKTELLTEKDSHGDAGIVIIHVSPKGFKFECLGGYLRVVKGAVKDLAAVTRTPSPFF
jgi:hypothetical protein